MHADVAQRQRAEDGIAQRMQDHVAVAVRHQAAVVRHAHAAEHHMLALAKGVDVVAVADADGHWAGFLMIGTGAGKYEANPPNPPPEDPVGAATAAIAAMAAPTAFALILPDGIG